MEGERWENYHLEYVLSVSSDVRVEDVAACVFLILFPFKFPHEHRGSKLKSYRQKLEKLTVFISVNSERTFKSPATQSSLCSLLRKPTPR
jgi:hypothetical protein